MITSLSIRNEDDQLVHICDEILYYYQEIQSINGTISCSHTYSSHAYELLYTFPISSNFICDVESVIKSSLSKEQFETLHSSTDHRKLRPIKIKLALAFQDATIYPIKKYISNFIKDLA